MSCTGAKTRTRKREGEEEGEGKGTRTAFGLKSVVSLFRLPPFDFLTTNRRFD
jgi:hypothetical protein